MLPSARPLAPFLALALAALCPLAGHAAKKSPLEAAREQLDEASFERAISIADAALKGNLSDTDRAALHLLRAEAYSALQKNGPMRDALDAALRADATASYDENTKPELLQALKEARQKLAGKVSVGAAPAGTPAPEVWIDGEAVGRAPVETSVSVGRHQVSLIWSATNRTDHAVMVKTDGVATVEVVPIKEEPPVVKPQAEVATTPSSTFRWPLVPLAAGGAVAAAGAVCMMVSGANYGALTGGDGVSTLNLSRAEAQAFADQNAAAQGVGIALFSVGLAAAAFGGVFFAFGLDQPKVAVAPAVGTNGVGVVFSGALP